MLVKYFKIFIVLPVILVYRVSVADDVSSEDDLQRVDFANYVSVGSEKVANIRDYVRQAKTENGMIDLNLLIQNNVMDPSPISDFNVTNKGFLADINGRFTDVSLYGLKGFRVNRVEVNLSKMELSADMFVPTLSVGGTYALDGSLTFFQVSGNGIFWMNLTNVVITGHSMFYPKEDGGLEMGDVNLHSEVGDINLNFENLMGGGTWSKLSNSVVNQLSEMILDELKQSLLKELGSFLRTQFNENLFQGVPTGFIDPNSESIVDDILRKAADMMVQNGLDPMRMPDLSKTYEHSMVFVTTRGQVNLTNGLLHGLTSLARKGDVIASLQNDSIVFEASFGFGNLTAIYDWQAKFFGISPSGALDVQVNSMEGFMKLRQELREGSELRLDDFSVTSVGQIWMNIDGLGTWDYVMEVFINLLTNGLKMQLADAVTGPVKTSIQEQINGLYISIS